MLGQKREGDEYAGSPPANGWFAGSFTRTAMDCGFPSSTTRAAVTPSGGTAKARASCRLVPGAASVEAGAANNNSPNADAAVNVVQSYDVSTRQSQPRTIHEI
jgi:hypothetical protein